MLIELPAADEIDDLAVTTPKFEVRKFELDLTDTKADLRYPPCKAQVVIVVKRGGATALSKTASGAWAVPSGMVRATEEIPQSAKRVAREQYGLMLRSIELAGIYDVIWHYSDLTVKRLHFVYAAATDEEPQGCPKSEVAFFEEADGTVSDEISRAALTDCRQK